MPAFQRFDRSSWSTLAIAGAIFAATLGVVRACLGQASDGWYVDRGAWGRYDYVIYLYPEQPENVGALRSGDVLLAVEGTPFELLEARAARLDPARPPDWRPGVTVRYTVLRDGREVDLDVTLTRPQPLSLYRPLVMLQDPILLTFPVFLLIGTLVFALRPRERAAQLLFLFGFAAFSDNFLTWSAAAPGVQDLFSAATYWPRIVLGNMTWTWLIMPLLVHLFLAFPAEKRLLRRFPRALPLLLYGTCAVASLLYAGASIAGAAVSSVAFAALVAVPCLLLSALGLMHSWLTASDPVARLQARWVALGGLVGIVGPVGLWVAAGGLTPRSPFWVDLLYFLMALGLPACLAVAILRYHLWAVEVVIRRTTIYGVLSGTLALIYFGSVIVLQQIFPAEAQASIVLSSLSVAALFAPLRRRVQNVIDRHFYRRKYDARRTLADFGASCQHEVDLDALESRLLAVVDETLQPAHSGLWIKDRESAAARRIGKHTGDQSWPLRN